MSAPSKADRLIADRESSAEFYAIVNAKLDVAKAFMDEARRCMAEGDMVGADLWLGRATATQDSMLAQMRRMNAEREQERSAEN